MMTEIYLDLILSIYLFRPYLSIYLFISTRGKNLLNQLVSINYLYSSKHLVNKVLKFISYQTIQKEIIFLSVKYTVVRKKTFFERWLRSQTLSEKCQNLEFFWSDKYVSILSLNTDQKNRNLETFHVLRSWEVTDKTNLLWCFIHQMCIERKLPTVISGFFNG